MKRCRRPTAWLLAVLISSFCALQGAQAQDGGATPEAAQTAPQKQPESTEGPDSSKPGQAESGAKPRPRIGVAMTAMPEITSQVPGAGCLLCLGVAHATMATLKEHLGKLPTEDLAKLKTELADMLGKQDADVVLIAEPLDLNSLPDSGKNMAMFARKDFSSIKEKYNLDKLAAIEISHIGVIRNFSGYFPTGAPRAYLAGSSYLLNLTSHGYDFLTRLHFVRAGEGPWDEPPKFPGMTNAYFQVIELARDHVLAEWRKGYRK